MDSEFALLKKLINTQIKKPKDFDLYVYFMRSFEHNLIKIGISENPHFRLKTISKELKSPIKLETYFPGNRKFELLLHLFFAKYRSKTDWGREWFKTNDKLDEIISLIKENEPLKLEGDGIKDSAFIKYWKNCPNKVLIRCTMPKDILEYVKEKAYADFGNNHSAFSMEVSKLVLIAKDCLEKQK